MDYKETLKYLDSFTNYEKIGLEKIDKEFNLDKLKDVLAKLGNPEDKYKSIHIAGTKGKGSVSVFTAAILESCGYKVGLFTSPHLVSPCERIKINGKMIDEKNLTNCFNKLLPCLGDDPAENFTFFEVYTLLAILYFGVEKVDFAVFEVGLGGRLDATNILHPIVCAISPVSYDHMNVLGNSLEKIASEKAAIIKNGASCIVAPQKKSVAEVIRKKCNEEKVPFKVVGKDITVEIKEASDNGTDFSVFTEKTKYESCKTIMPGVFQPENAAVAIGICEDIVGADPRIRPLSNIDTIKNGVSKAFMPGRLEILRKNPYLIVDGAQNEDSAVQLKYSVEQIFKYDKLVLLLGICRDKDIKGICKNLAPIADEIILTRAKIDRAADPEIIRGHIRESKSQRVKESKKKVHITRDVKEALGLAFKSAGDNDLILATGSFYVVGEVREAVCGTC